MKLKFNIKNYPNTAQSWLPNLLQAETEIRPAATVGLKDTAIMEISSTIRDTIQAIEIDIFNRPAGYTSLNNTAGYKTIWLFPLLETGTYVLDWTAGTMTKEVGNNDPGDTPGGSGDTSNGSGGSLWPLLIIAGGLIVLASRR